MTESPLPRIVVHTPEHVSAALAAARAGRRRVILQSPPDCARRAGIPWFLALVAEAGDAALAVLDCGDAAGLALGALREGAPAVRVERPPPALAEIAAALGREVDTAPAVPLLDLRDVRDPAEACRRFLGLE